MIAPRQPEQPDPPGGLGGRSTRTETGLTLIHDARLLQRGVREGWIVAKRWPTRQTQSELEKAKDSGEITLVERAALGAFELINSGDARAIGIGCNIATVMEAQNQADEHKTQPDLHLHAQQPQLIEVVVKSRDEILTLEALQERVKQP